MKKIGLIGAGNIGKFILESLNMKQLIPNCRISSLYYRSGKEREWFVKKYGVSVFTDFQSFIDQGLDLIIEAATVEAVKEFAPQILRSQADLVIVSVGALADPAFYHDLKQLCETFHTSIYLPSGAIGGLDMIKAANSVGELSYVLITTRKPPQALMNQPIEEETVLFEGSAKEAIARFPKNVNVAILLSLAGLGAEKTKVRVIADPLVTQNTHTIEASGSFGKTLLTIENQPMPSNPKTSYLAALSVIATLKDLHNAIQVG